jgi:hypothetical protein
MTSFVDVGSGGIIEVSHSENDPVFENGFTAFPMTVSLNAVSPGVISSQPTFSLTATINVQGLNGISRVVDIFPTIPDYAPSGVYIDANGNRGTPTGFLSALNVWPVRRIIGDLYFQIELGLINGRQEYVSGSFLNVN